jgi:N-acetylglutamate synthase-like GNAT family acetyltransferase
VDGNDSISVRRAEPNLVDLVASLTVLINRAYSPAILELWTAAFDRIQPADVAELFTTGSVFIAERRGEVIGCVHYRELAARTAWFGLLAVDPDAAGAGVGAVLVDAVETAAMSTGRSGIELDLLVPAIDTPHQSRLRDWYQRRGYRETSRTHFRPDDVAREETLRSPCMTVRYRKQLR